MDAARCPVCRWEAGDRVEGLKGQGGAAVVLLICQGCGNVFTAKRDRPPVPLQMFRPVRGRTRRSESAGEER
jgi:hypothetical protein